MVHYRVFLGAPSPADVTTDPGSYTWKTTESTLSSSSFSQPSLVYPPATLDAASRRISLLYQDVIFNDDGPDYDETHDISERPDRTSTFMTWPPTPAAVDQSINNITTDQPSFLLPSQSQPPPPGTYETQETVSYAYSDEDGCSPSTIARFPNFQFSLHSLTSLSSLSNASKSASARDHFYHRQQGPGSSRKANVLVAILEVEGPDMIKVKKGIDAGKEVSILKMILGDEEGCVCRLTAWRDTAEVWGGYGSDPDPPLAMKRGDVVYFENISATISPPDVYSRPGQGTTPILTPTLALTASPAMRPPPRAQLCYRTLPSTHTDALLRPDLRLGKSDAAIRRVGGLVRWFEGVAGIGTS
ncbi:hypothetical protein V8B97DRAFT_1876103 [Scleroderma yunnanense]